MAPQDSLNPHDSCFNTGVPHIARVYDYWLGGRDHFPADRELGEKTMAAYPNLALSARANRGFLARAVRSLAAEAGIRQFLDIGTGIRPTTTPTRSRSGPPRPAAHPRAPARTWRATCGSRRRSCPRLRTP